MNNFGRLVWVAGFGVLLAGCHSDKTINAAVTPKTGGSASRRNVKTATDADAAKISKTPKDTTIEEILAQKGPADGNLTGRQDPFETSTWKVKAKLESVQLMKDGDYYLVMKGDKGGETVVEVPDPKECKDSPLEPEIAATRKQLEDRYHPTSDVKKIDDEATVTGVGFLGWGGKSKSAKGHSGPRLMPGTGFDFGTKA
jgi:hypothetical protein